MPVKFSSSNNDPIKAFPKVPAKHLLFVGAVYIFKNCEGGQEIMQKKVMSKDKYSSKLKELRRKEHGAFDVKTDARSRYNCCKESHKMKCKYVDYTCKKCGKIGHLIKMFKKNTIEYVEERSNSSESDSDDGNNKERFRRFKLFTLSAPWFFFLSSY